ncbi:hypothetical protein AQUCO_35200001v1 [Aquilegia coerulea]|uniref:CCHC-type domain-containing protein n=1 Tax=Aquilegia coerulea TaxID=218851 RepID=A0A2G5C0I7_AQUCA|nr:hypothetical protein AQUCO_35200001v1 [Aquilegia coerulea]
MENELLNWDMPRIEPKRIYNIGSFDYKVAMSIKTVEHTMPINGNKKSIPLITEQDIIRYRQNYHYIHIGLIQIAVKPLHLKGIDCCFLLALRDARCTNYQKSLMGIMESTTSNGLVYCNIYPNLELSLSDDNIMQSVMMDLDTKGYEFLFGSEILNIAYRIQFKVMNTLSSNAKLISNKGNTTIIETNLGKSNMACNKIIPWDQISYPKNWDHQGIIPAQPVNRNLDQIIQNPEGDIEIRFSSNRISRLRSVKNFYYQEPSRSSTSSIPDKIDDEFEIKGIKESNNAIPHGLYNRTSALNPTPSEMNFNINMIELVNDFKIDRVAISNEWKDPKYNAFRKWYKDQYNDGQHEFLKENYYKYLNDTKNIIPFAHYVLRWDRTLESCVIKEFYNNWTTTDGKNIKAVHPPTQPLKLINETYYPRPTPIDILNEEDYIAVQTSYSAKTIYEWNIHSLSEYMIYVTLHRILMFATVCKNSNNTDKQTAGCIIAGFTGQLKGWWDNLLTPSQREEILGSVKLEINTSGQQSHIEDAVYTLIQTIIKHFIGNTITANERGKDLLMNLKCPTLTHFRWYKDVFMAKITNRHDGNNAFWKEKFISGLPILFAEKVKNRLKNKHDGIQIPYDYYTYGELISECTSEGLALCNDIRLKNQLKKQNLTGKKELGQFCEQFGYDMPKQKDKNDLSQKRFSKKYFRRKPYKRPDQVLPKSKSNFSPKENFKNITCHKCGKKGHYANRCYSKTDIRKQINELGIDDNIKKQINQILDNNETSSSYYSDASSDQIMEVEELTNSESDISNQSGKGCSAHCKTSQDYYKAIIDMNGLSINVLSESQTLILDMIDNIVDPTEKRQAIEKYIKDSYNNKLNSSIMEPYSLQKVFDRIESKPLIKEAPISEFRKEINNFKTEINNLKWRISRLEVKNTLPIPVINMDETRGLLSLDNNIN